MVLDREVVVLESADRGLCVPDKYVIFPPTSPPPALNSPPRLAIVVDRKAIEVPPSPLPAYALAIRQVRY
eukprot:2771001-Rhodomonas_salina.1